MRRLLCSHVRCLATQRWVSSTAAEGDDVITPWEVTAKGPKGINYDRVLETFKAERVDEDVMGRLTRLAAQRHVKGQGTTTSSVGEHLFRRSIAFSHRDFGTALSEIEACVAQGLPPRAYLYTGRGPSAGSMHLGHAIPFLLTKYLQDALGLPLVIQLTDDEKYLFRGVEFDGAEAEERIMSNIKDILAFGFDPARTFVFRNTEFMGSMYRTILPLQRSLTINAVRHTLGIQDSDNIGRLAFPAIQAAPCFPSCFEGILPEASQKRQQQQKPWRCIVPCAIDQDPFFVLTRSIAPRLKLLPPAVLHTKFLPALKGPTHKMSSSAEGNGVISLQDSDEAVTKKLRKAFSGGRARLDEMQAMGAELDVDVAFQFIRFLCPDEQFFARVSADYGCGAMNSGEVKKLAAEVVVRDVLRDWRSRRAALTDEDVAAFTRTRPIAE